MIARTKILYTKVHAFVGFAKAYDFYAATRGEFFAEESRVIDPEGRVWNTYHARFGATAPRSSAIRQVFFDVDGAPVLDVLVKGLG